MISLQSVAAQISLEKLESIYIFKMISLIKKQEKQISFQYFKLCVFKDDVLLGHMKEVYSGKKIRDLEIKTVEITNLKKADTCNVIIIGKESGDIDEFFKFISSKLLITKNQKHFDKTMILFKIKKKKLVFDINYKLADINGFNISTRLLRLADKVKK